MSNWLSLKKAADRLGVHPTTLRRWADNGDIPVYVTPGGHRRFLESDIEDIMHHDVTDTESVPHDVLTNRALTTTQNRLKQPTHIKWLDVFDDDDRERQRKLGQRLLALIMQHISSADEDERLLIEAEHFAVDYAESCAAQGLTAAQALEIVIFFRDGIVETALQMPNVAAFDDDMHLRLMRRINQVFNILQVTLIKHYDRLS